MQIKKKKENKMDRNDRRNEALLRLMDVNTTRVILKSEN